MVRTSLKKCPPGVFCIENLTLYFAFVVVFFLGLMAFQYFRNIVSEPKHSGIHQSESITQSHTNNLYQDVTRNDETSGYFTRPSSLYNNAPQDVFFNPYAPPLKENPFFNSSVHDVRGDIDPLPRHSIPINVNTRRRNYEYRQIGILTRNDGSETILPLFGRPVDTGRDKWQYYTLKEGHAMVKLPVSKGGRSCTNEYGCNEIFNGDTLYVEGYKDIFNAVVYENDEPRYIPL